MANTVCLVTNELFPIEKGGIGRLMYNFATTNAQRDSRVDFHLLLSPNLRSHADAIEAAYQGLATVHYCKDSLDALGGLGRLMASFQGKDALDGHMTTSLRYYAGLLDAQKALGRDFDIVEFPDFGGWAAASIAAKKAGVTFADTAIAVRLHSTFTLIADHEPFSHPPSEWMAGISDLERQSLRDADVIVAHLSSIAELNASRFAFGKEWLQKVRVETPPIVLAPDERDSVAEADQVPALRKVAKNFLFSARLQPFKRPDLFIRAAVCFLDRTAHTDSTFFISSYGWDADYIDWLHRLVPPRWKNSILFLEDLTQRERADLLRDCIVVVPSDFESFCLLAYEARALGSKVILNRRCIGFGAEPAKWREGEDCLFFEGDFISLSETMERALKWEPAPFTLPRPTTPYWESAIEDLGCRKAPPAPPLSMAYVVYGTTDLEMLGKRAQELQLLMGDRSARTEICVLVPREALHAASISLSSWRVAGVDVYETSWLEPTPSEIQHLVSRSRCDAVAFLPTDMWIDSRLWTLAASQLAKHPSVAAFTSHVTLRDGESDRRYVLNYGDAPTIALMSDRIAHRGSVFRRQWLTELGLREQAGERWFEDLCVRTVSKGGRIIVAPSALAAQSGQRKSRIPSARFFGTHRDEAGQLHATPYRQGSAATKLFDSIQTIDHKDWVAHMEEERANLSSFVPVALQALSFEEVLLKNAFSDPGSDYRGLEIVIRGLVIGRVSLGWLGFKLGDYKGEPHLEFRDGGNARGFFTSWPPPTFDEWGAVAVLVPTGKSHPHGILFESMDEVETRRLKLILDNLPAMIGLLPLSDEERGRWEKLAAALAAQPAGDTRPSAKRFTVAQARPNLRKAANSWLSKLKR